MSPSAFSCRTAFWTVGGLMSYSRVEGWLETVESWALDADEDDYPAGERVVLAKLHKALCEARDELEATVS
jgi:hypothetical protein